MRRAKGLARLAAAMDLSADGQTVAVLEQTRANEPADRLVLRACATGKPIQRDPWRPGATLTALACVGGGRVVVADTADTLHVLDLATQRALKTVPRVKSVRRPRPVRALTIPGRRARTLGRPEVPYHGSVRPLSIPRVLVALSVLTSACTSPEPATPATPATSATPVVATPPTAKPSPPEPVTRDRDDEDEESPKIIAGIVPAELTADLLEIEHPFPSPLAEPNECIAKQSDQNCFWDIPTIVGFSRERGEVAFFYVPRIHADEKKPQELIGERVRLADGKSQEHKKFGPIVPEGGPEPALNAKLRDTAREWIHRLKQDGFAAGHDMKAWGGAVRDRGAIGFPLAVLAAPMTGWMIYAPAPPGDTLTLKLIAPDNKQEFIIGTAPVGTGEKKARFTSVSFGSVELDPTHTTLVALFSASTLSQDEEGLNDWRVFTLPPEVRAALPKP